jgi:hypothetical protein
MRTPRGFGVESAPVDRLTLLSRLGTIHGPEPHIEHRLILCWLRVDRLCVLNRREQKRVNVLECLLIVHKKVKQIVPILIGKRDLLELRLRQLDKTLLEILIVTLDPSQHDFLPHCVQTFPKQLLKFRPLYCLLSCH